MLRVNVLHPLQTFKAITSPGENPRRFKHVGNATSDLSLLQGRVVGEKLCNEVDASLRNIPSRVQQVDK